MQARWLGPIAITGPTASGKTAAAMAVARKYACEIISVDSALVYRGMDIGTAKPTASELAEVPHHLINIRDPLHPYSAADFVQDARQLIRDIQARGKLPLLVGGTMMYLKALVEGLDDMPKANPALRAELEQEAGEKGWPAMHAALARVDPITASRLQPNDSQRIQRALEVHRISGASLSSFQLRKHAITSIAIDAYKSGARGQFGIKNTPFSVFLISLEPSDRAWLHARIEQRFDAMLAAGFLDEVKALRKRGDLQADLPAIRCVGYRQAWEYLDSVDESGQKDEPSGAPSWRDRGVFATRQLAKRQLTWLRSMPQRHSIAADAPDAVEQVMQGIDQLMHNEKTS